MASLLVIIFVVEVTVAVVNAIGATTINNLVWTPLPTFPNVGLHAREEMEENCETARLTTNWGIKNKTALGLVHLSPFRHLEPDTRAARAPKVIPQGAPRPERYEQPGRVCQVGEAATAAR